MTIADRVEQLFDGTAGQLGRPVTLQSVVDLINERGIATMSRSYLHQLRTGQAENPRLQHLRAIADVFGVPVSYFFEDEESGDESGEGLAALSSDERHLALRAHGLSPDALSSIRKMIELARKGEKLDEEGA